MQASRGIDGAQTAPRCFGALERGFDASSKGAADGFTLVEMLVSMAVLVLLVMVLTQVLNQSNIAWLQGEANKEVLQNERAIGDFIANELRLALLPVNRTNTTSLQLVVNSGLIASGTFNNRDSIFWQMPLASDQTLGDIAEVGYFVQWDTTTNPLNPKAQLCRFFVNPGDPNYLIDSNPSPWLSGSIVNAVAPANNKNGNAYQGLFAENVLGLWVQCFDPLGHVIVYEIDGSTPFPGPPPDYSFDSRLGYTYTDVSLPVGGRTVYKNPCSLPAAIDVSLVMLDAHRAARVGPAQQSAIMTLCTSSTDASAFVTSSFTTPGLQTIAPGLRAYKTRIYFEDSR